MTCLAYAPRRTPPVPRPTERFEQDPAAAICLTGELAHARDGADTSAEIGDVFAGPRLTWHCREAVAAAHTPLLDAPRAYRVRVATAFLLAAIACDALGDPDAIERAVGRVFDLTETGTMLFLFPRPAPGRRGHQARHRAAPTALICEAVDLLAQVGRPAPPSELARRCERLTGAYALGPGAGEWLQQAMLAVRARVPLHVLRDVIQPWPPFSLIYADALKALQGSIAAARQPAGAGSP